ncbi:hypothetical protein AB3662_27210 [Sorangium cellulosum]|uniref:hypothetical protein n=1 Tax=Sorangium cellulosum TaxID=56 RepID=UPI003D9A4D91
MALWKLTEAEGDNKYRTRYRTAAALTSTALQHDHVIQQASLLDALCAFPESADELLSCAVACTVTVPEHEELTEYSRLNPHIDGWARYEELGLTVIDTCTGDAVNLRYLAKIHEHHLLARARVAGRRASTWRQFFDELKIEYEISRDRIANSPLRHDGKSLHIYFHDRVRKPPSFSAHEQFFSDFSWDCWEVLPEATTKGYVRVAPECDFERDALAAMCQYAATRT